MERLLIMCVALVACTALLVIDKGCEASQQFELRMTQMGMCRQFGTSNWQPCIQTFQLPRR